MAPHRRTASIAAAAAIRSARNGARNIGCSASTADDERHRRARGSCDPYRPGAIDKAVCDLDRARPAAKSRGMQVAAEHGVRRATVPIAPRPPTRAQPCTRRRQARRAHPPVPRSAARRISGRVVGRARIVGGESRESPRAAANGLYGARRFRIGTDAVIDSCVSAPQGWRSLRRDFGREYPEPPPSAHLQRS